MRRQIKVIWDLLERIAVAGPAVDVMATVRMELTRLNQRAAEMQKELEILQAPPEKEEPDG